jgi:hypothetical protein
LIAFLAGSATIARMSTLYHGDNLDILRRYLKNETVNEQAAKIELHCYSFNTVE